MRAYRAASEEALHARDLLKDWAGEGFLTHAQYQRMEQETGCELRRTNVFLRVVLFLFTLIIVGAAVGLFAVVFLSGTTAQTAGTFLLAVAAGSYAAAELAVSRARLYRYGTEEALLACSVVSLCVGMWAVLFSDRSYSPMPDEMRALIPAIGAFACLWIWHRFGLPYALVAAMVFVLWLPGHWTSSHWAQHVMVAVFYAAGLTAVAAVRTRHGFGYLNEHYQIAEAFLWLGIYLAINLQLSPVSLLRDWGFVPRTTTDFPRVFYWGAWVLIWCLPPAILARGLRGKDRFVMAVGALVAVLTLATNKAYLEWHRNTWDPMLLGGLLIGAALFIRRWLAAGPDGIRRGFTARRLSGKDEQYKNAASAAFGLASPQSITMGQGTASSGVRFGGGDSGGGGATSDF